MSYCGSSRFESLCPKCAFSTSRLFYFVRSNICFKSLSLNGFGWPKLGYRVMATQPQLIRGYSYCGSSRFEPSCPNSGLRNSVLQSFHRTSVLYHVFNCFCHVYDVTKRMGCGGRVRYLSPLPPDANSAILFSIFALWILSSLLVRRHCLVLVATQNFGFTEQNIT